MSTRTRSPNYPLIDLKRSLELTQALYRAAQRHPMPISDVVKDVWKMSPTSSLGGQAAAALRAFGLVEIDGERALRRIRVSEDAAKVLENHPEREKLLVASALRPRVHRTTWERCAKDGELPPDATLRQFLLFDHDPRFNEAAISGFIKQLRSTLHFAQVKSGGIVGQSEENGGDEPDNPSPGDWVQWSSQGVNQFPIPRRVVRVTEDGFAFVEGTNTGIPVSELRVTDPPAPPLHPLAQREQPGMHQNTLQLDEGSVILQYPARISPESYEDLKVWLELMSRRVKRAVQGDEDAGSPEAA